MIRLSPKVGFVSPVLKSGRVLTKKINGFVNTFQSVDQTVVVVSSNNVLREDGFYILREDGFKIIRES